MTTRVPVWWRSAQDYGSQILVEVTNEGEPIRFGVTANEGRFGATLSLEQVEEALRDYQARQAAWNKDHERI